MNADRHGDVPLSGQTKLHGQTENPKQVKTFLVARTVFFGLTALFVLCLTVQIFLAGLAVFYEPAYWGSHNSFVQLFELIPFLMLILALVGRLPRKLIGQSVALLFFIFLMYVTANFGAKIPYVAALHPVLAMVMYGMAHRFLIESWRALRPAHQEGN